MIGSGVVCQNGIALLVKPLSLVLSVPAKAQSGGDPVAALAHELNLTQELRAKQKQYLEIVQQNVAALLN